MIYIIVAIKDRALDGYMRPFFAQSTGQAIRMFGDEINRAADDNPLYRHPDDHDLYQLGTYNDQTGWIGNANSDNGPTYQPHQLAIGKQLKGANAT